MGVILQVRDIDVEILDRLRKSAASEGVSLSAFVRRRLEELARFLELEERANYLNSDLVRNALGGPFPELSGVPTEQIVDIIREQRGPLG